MNESRELRRLVKELDHAVRGTPWHGAALMDQLKDLSAADAAAHPIPGAHSIWELVLHMIAWTHEATHRLRGGVPDEPADGDWPRVPSSPSEPLWEAAKARLITAHEALLATLQRMDEAELDANPVPGRHLALGTGVKHRVLVHGLSQHHAYHSGQIALLRRALTPPALP